MAGIWRYIVASVPPVPRPRHVPHVLERSDVICIFPNDAALIRLAGALLIEQNDEWLVGRRYLSESSMHLVVAQTEDNEGEKINDQEVPELQAA